MDYTIKKNCSNIEWTSVPNLLKKVGMGYHSAEIHKKAFENSYCKVFIFDKDNLIGMGRAISDGVYQGAIYDIAIEPEYQGRGLGKVIVNNLLEDMEGFNVILYASPGKEDFYKRLNFKKMKTGMAIFKNSNIMIERGFLEK